MDTNEHRELIAKVASGEVSQKEYFNALQKIAEDNELNDTRRPVSR